MTEPHTATPADMPEHPVPENLEAAKKLRAENKKLRDRLRALETDHEAAVSRLDGMRHAEVERIAAEHLIDAADIWTAAQDVNNLVDDDGLVDAGKVSEAAQALVAEKPHLGASYRPQNRPPTERPIESLKPGASPSRGQHSTPTWADVFRPLVPPRG